MGEARLRKRAHATLDGGPPSQIPTVLQIEVFDPRNQELVLADATRMAALEKTYRRAYQRPTAICAACDCESACGEPPQVSFCTRPVFPEAEAFETIVGMICAACANLPPDELMAALVGHLRAMDPNIAVATTGSA